ncbi:amidohydrolase [Coraliomargarita akajimensis]|uniref:Amidohydrolase 3 n=1 Tax=Coraliomargarita akajimensis (strain DSM 45221 / IAM 15411 / JCM 23193 / KCTC 12865 / 04OKA010-24) TaxID=583355 RepID=D5EIX2_CORAD|nr:amidohydrolase [Coraliomargarita akajimensis]ADE54371.1 Amidohydrolase 3 [Coraliomargarita akajimensis DSM 45221]
MKTLLRLALSYCSLTVLFGSPTRLRADTADRIYTNGVILTMDDTKPKAEAVAVKNGKILAVGSATEVLKTRDRATEIHDLSGKALLPGFVDSHGHMMGGGIQALSANLLAPPDGDVRDIASLQATLRTWMAENQQAIDQIQLVIGFGYDNAQLAELRHPNRDDLDAVSSDIPIILVHQSGHIVAVNSKALEIGGISATTLDPQGGVIRRDSDGIEPNGVLEETAAFPLLIKLLARVGPEGSEAFVRAGAEMWARYGYTTAQDGRSMPGGVKTLKAVAQAGGLPIDVISYPDVLVGRDLIKREVSSEYVNRFRVAGAKLTIDGSPQGFTAWRDRPYYDPVGNYPPGYVGYPAATEEQVANAIDWAYAHDIQIITHSNGEAASDQLIAYIHAAAQKHGKQDRRPVLIHGQFLREDQVDALKRLEIFPSLFPMHTYYWGDWHREQTVGPVLSNYISPTGWCVQRGMKFGTHHDAPVALPNSMRVLDATVTRRSRSGDILGPDQRVDVLTALKAMTLWPAWQHFEEASKGSIEVGKLADFVILDQDPTAINPEDLDQIKVLQTIKEGVSVYQHTHSTERRVSLQHGDQPQIAFNRALGSINRHLGSSSAQAGGLCSDCLCSSVSYLTDLIGRGESQ